MIEFADAPAAPKKEKKPDPMLEEIIRDLIAGGNIMLKCRHTSKTKGPCPLCSITWEGCVDNAMKVMSGMAELRKGKK